MNNVAGIDVSKGKSMVSVLRPFGEVVTKPFSVGHTGSELKELADYDDAYYHRDDPDNEEPLCYTCHSHYTGGRSIQDYYYKPEPTFYGNGPRFFGVELEIDGGGENSLHARRLLRLANDGMERIYCKHDGSLDEGFEIVTHPMSLDYQLHQMPWMQLCKEAVTMGYTSHQAGTCGLHIHVSRLAFGEDRGMSARHFALSGILAFFHRECYDWCGKG